MIGLLHNHSLCEQFLVCVAHFTCYFHRTQYSASERKENQMVVIFIYCYYYYYYYILLLLLLLLCQPGSSVWYSDCLRAGRSAIESQWGRDISPVQTGPGAHPASCKMVTGSFPGVKCGRGVLLTTHPLLVPRSWKSTAKPLATLWPKPVL